MSGLIREYTDRDDLSEFRRIRPRGRRQVEGIAELLRLWLATVYVGSQGPHPRISVPPVHYNIQWRHGSGERWYWATGVDYYGEQNGR